MKEEQEHSGSNAAIWPMHRNPVKRGLVEAPEQWQWSSFRHYATGEIGMVEIESFWTAGRRESLRDPRSQNRDLRHPGYVVGKGAGRPALRPASPLETQKVYSEHS